MEEPQPTSTEKKGLYERAADLIWEHGTFYRIHVAAFTLIPLVAAGVFYACNGRFHVSFIDSLFICYSAMTVTGLSTVNLSTTTAFQQSLLYFLMLIGDFTVVSWIMVLVRKWYFRNVCQYVDGKRRRRPFPRSRTSFLKAISSPVSVFKNREEVPAQEKSELGLDAASNPTIQLIGPTPAATMNVRDAPERMEGRRSEESGQDARVFSETRTFSSSPRAASLVLSPTTQSARGVNFAVSTSLQPVRTNTVREGVAFPRRTATVYSSTRRVEPEHKKFQGFGGFPGPISLVKRIFKRGAPKAYRSIQRKLTLPFTETLEASKVPWLRFDGLVVGRNSAFHTETLTDEQVEDIGGVEYRALRLLSYLVPAYFVGTQLFAFILFAPWLSSTNKYDTVFAAQPRNVEKPWYSWFLVLSAYSGGGLSLVDMGMLPFQSAYLMIFGVMFVILAGNHGLPIFLRLTIWTWSKLARAGSETADTLSFLLAHPRRCFLYLFPSHQTWYLTIVLVTFSAIEWAAFEVLDIGLPFYQAIPEGPRVVAGLFQGLAARASGLAIVPLASSSPALQFLYIIMMYIAVYPIAMTVRSTNVYEAESLGVFEEPPAEEDEEPTDLDNYEPRERVGRYLLWHLERQMSIDLWWLVWGVFLVSVIERGSIIDENKKWFDMFRVIFELVSAFGGIGLSLGLPTDNFSFSGALTPLSKLVVIVIMIRGRHRGLPVGVERAVTLPRELKTENSRGQTPATSAAPNANANGNEMNGGVLLTP
ncbi:Potassium transporter [Mycena kentingensis (nom. inval.)]|nr:Potassium transporter [Mycena kentingensis (nom. inval.)]